MSIVHDATGQSAAARNSPLSDRVFEQLREQVVTGLLEPGSRLRVRDLAEQVGTSAMPVREAVRRLVESGLAEHEPYKGARVRRLDLAELESAYEVRILLEGECARLGALAASTQTAERMHMHWENLERAIFDHKILLALEADEALLNELYEASGNRVLVATIHDLWEKCRPYRIYWASGGKGNSAASSLINQWKYKPELIHAVREGNGRMAEAIMHDSYRRAIVQLSTTLAGSGS